VSKILATDHSYLKLNLVIAQNHNQICISVKIKEVKGMENGDTLPGERYWGKRTARERGGERMRERGNREGNLVVGLRWREKHV
jgi:hypothetical protein